MAFLLVTITLMISEIKIVTSKNWIIDIKNEHIVFQICEMEFQLEKINSWYQQLVLNGSLWWHFTSENTIVDIKNYIFHIKNYIFDIKNVIVDINNWILDIKKCNCWYQEFISWKWIKASSL